MSSLLLWEEQAAAVLCFVKRDDGMGRDGLWRRSCREEQEEALNESEGGQEYNKALSEAAERGGKEVQHEGRTQKGLTCDVFGRNSPWKTYISCS